MNCREYKAAIKKRKVHCSTYRTKKKALKVVSDNYFERVNVISSD